MGKIRTKELLDNFFNSISHESAMYTKRISIDKPILYDYEKQIGKELIDMNADDLLGLIKELCNKRDGVDIPFMTAHYSYGQISSLLRSIFEFYIDEVEPIKNPMHDKRMKGREAIKGLAKDKKALNFNYIQNLINRLHDEEREDRADYVELIMLLYYSGFKNAKEIITFKGDAINHKKKTIDLIERTVQLTDRCYELLQKFDNMNTMVEWRTFCLAPYRDGYFKFIIQEKQLDKFNDRDIELVAVMLNRYISVYINQKYGTKISYNTLFLLGFYDSIVKEYGGKETDRMILSYRNSEDACKLMNCAKNYGIETNNISNLKRLLTPFVNEIN